MRAHVRATTDAILLTLRRGSLTQLRLLACILPQLKQSSAIGRATALQPSQHPRLDSPCQPSQLTASDLRVGPPAHQEPHTAVSSKRASNLLPPHSSTCFHKPANSLRPTSRATFPVYPDLLDCVSRSSTLCIVCCSAYRLCIILSSAYC